MLLQIRFDASCSALLVYLLLVSLGSTQRPNTPTLWSALGINCRGSVYCLGQDKSNVTGRILELTAKIAPHDIYGFGAHIACLGATDPLWRNTGAFCLYMQGANPHGIYNPITGNRVIGIQGDLIKTKIQDLYLHGCRACGSIPLSNDNDPNAQGILTLNYVANNGGCAGSNTVCKPTIAASDSFHNPLNSGQDFINTPEVINQTADGSQPCAAPGSPIVTDPMGEPLEDCNPGGPSPNPSSIARSTTLRSSIKPTPTLTSLSVAPSTSSETPDEVLWGGKPKLFR